MAMAELASRQREREADAPAGKPPRPVSLAEIAAAQMLSLAYLEQLFGRLRRAELVASARGPGGGYRLARPATAIAIADIVEAVDEPIRATRCEMEGQGCMGGDRCLTHELWSELSEHIRLFLAEVTLADVVARQLAGRAQGPAVAAPPVRATAPAE